MGVEGNLDLYHNNDGRMASLYWNGPWTRTDNLFNVTNLNSEEYILNMSPIPESGILGDVSVVVAQTGRWKFDPGILVTVFSRALLSKVETRCMPSLNGSLFFGAEIRLLFNPMPFVQVLEYPHFSGDQ